MFKIYGDGKLIGQFDSYVTSFITTDTHDICTITYPLTTDKRDKLKSIDGNVFVDFGNKTEGPLFISRCVDYSENNLRIDFKRVDQSQDK